MAKHDILVWNATSSIFETNLSSNTARIKGDSSALLSIESGSTELFKIDTTNSSVIFETHVTASGNISGSATSTASFGGNVIVDRLSGNASLMTGADTFQEGHLSSSAQLATEISGAFDSGFRMLSGSLISGSSTSTGSFGYIYASDFDITHANELVGLINVSESAGTLSGSAQIASAISGAFDSGFIYTGEISGSSTTTGSFGDLYSDDYPSDADITEVVNVEQSYPTNTISSSAQLATEISGAFDSGFIYTGEISGSSTTTASIDSFFVNDWSGISSFAGFTNYIPTGTISSSAHLATSISGSFNKGFEFDGTLQGITVGDDFVTNGTFASDTGWTKETGWTITGGKAVSTDADATYTIHQTSAQTITANTTYRVTYTMSDFSSSPSGLKIRIGNELLGTGRASNGTFVEDITTGGSIANQQIGFYSAGASNTFKIDDVKFQEVLKGADSNSTGSFGVVHASDYSGDASGLINTPEDGHFSGSAPMAADISGSFISGFRVSGSAGAGQPLISGSSASTASLDYIFSDYYSGDVTDITNVYDGTGGISGSGGIATEISGAFTSGWRMGSGSSVAHFDRVGEVSLLSSNAGGYWTQGGDLIIARYGAGAGGTQNAGIKAGGQGGLTATELYNGSAWSIAANLSQTKYSDSAGAGNATAYLAFAGQSDQDGTAEFNGESWTNVNNTNTARRHVHGGGTQNSAVLTGGAPNHPLTETYDGSVWSVAAEMITGRYNHGSTGVSNAHLVVGGVPDSKSTEEYNGTSWATAACHYENIAKGTAMGSQNDAMAGGNTPGHWTLYNGTTWTAAASLSTNSDYGRGASGNPGGSAAGFITGDYNPATTGYTYNWHGGYTVTASLSKFNSKTFETEEITITGSAVKIPVFSSTFNVDTRHRESDAEYQKLGHSEVTQSAVSQSAKPIQEYLGSDTVGQLFVTNDGRLNFTYPTASVGYNPDSTDSGSYGVWSVTTGHNVVRCNQGGSGIQNAALMFGGQIAGYAKNYTEEWDGISWTANTPAGAFSGGLTAGRSSLWGTGIVNATLAGAGYNAPTRNCTEEYDGQSWAVGGALIQDRGVGAGVGTVNAATTFGGRNGPTKYANTENYNGSTWSVAGSLSTIGMSMGAMGSQNAALAAGGSYFGAPASNDSTCVEESNGINWSSATSLTTGRREPVGGGTQNAAFAAGGDYPGFAGATEEYDGTAWSKSGNLSTGRGYAVGGGDTSEGIAMGGKTPTEVTCTELYHGGTFHGTLSAWSSGNNMITARRYTMGAAGGLQNAALAVGGSEPAISDHVEEYDGTTWADGTFLINTTRGAGVGGTQTAAVKFGGQPNTATEEYNGFVWTVAGAMSTGVRYLGSAGSSQNASLAFGGLSPSYETDTEEYNGVAWSAGGALGTAVGYNTGVGTTNAALSLGGKNPASAVAGAVSGSTCHYDGSTWSVGGGLIHDVRESTSAGTQNAALLYGGTADPAAAAQTAEYDGNVWAAVTDMNDGRFGAARGGGTDFALAGGGGSPGASNKTEEYVKTHSGKPYILNKKIKAQE